MWPFKRKPSIIAIRRAEVAAVDAKRTALREQYPSMRACGIGLMAYDMWQPGMYCRKLLVMFG